MQTEEPADGLAKAFVIWPIRGISFWHAPPLTASRAVIGGALTTGKAVDVIACSVVTRSRRCKVTRLIISVITSPVSLLWYNPSGATD
jgi:hypothetical protein